MKISATNINTNGQIIDLTKPSQLKAEQIALVKNFFLGQNINASVKVQIDGIEEEVANYSNFLNSKLEGIVNIGNLNEYILNAESLDEEYIKTKSIVKSLIPKATNKDAKFASLTSGLTEDQKSSFDKMVDIMTKIKQLEKAVDSYQNQKNEKENASSKIKQKEAEKLALDQKLSSVQSLLEHKMAVEKKISEYRVEDLSVVNLDKIKEERINTRNQTYLNGFKQPNAKLFREEGPLKERFKLYYPWLLGIAFFQLVLSFVYNIFSDNNSNFLIGLISTILLIVVYLFLQIVSREKSTKSEQNVDVEQEDSVIVQNNVSNLDDSKILKLAYLNALNEELENISVSIGKSLDNETYEGAKQKLNVINSELDALNKLLNGEGNQVMSVDDYYKKRRELDILKIEKENMDFSTNLPVKPDEEYIEMVIQANSSESLNESVYLPIIIISKDRKVDEIVDKYNNIRQVIVLYEIS